MDYTIPLTFAITQISEYNYSNTPYKYYINVTLWVSLSPTYPLNTLLFIDN